MFGQVFLFELKQRMKSPVIWVLAILLCLKTISDMLGGEWQGLAGGGVPRNAPFAIYYVCVYATFWTAIFGAGLMTASLLRDAQTRMAPLVNSSRVTSGGYFWGKFFASLAGLSVVTLGVVAGIALVPFVEQLFHLVPPMQLIPTPWAHVFVGWLVWLLPGCFIYGSLHFALASLTGRTLPSYGLAVLSMAVFTLFFVAFSGVTGTHLFWLEVLDPMGHHTVTSQLSLWTVPERSHRFLQPTPGLLLNRALYIGGAALLLLIARLRFSLPALMARVKSPTRQPKRKMEEAEQGANYAIGSRTTHSHIQHRARARSSRIAWYLAQRELRITWGGTAFRIIIAAVVLLGFLSARYGTTDYYTQPEQHVLPAAQYLLELTGKQMFMMLIMAGVYFGSEMLARDRTARMAVLIDTAPATTGTLAGAKFLAITMLALTLAPLPALTVFLFQLFSGYRELFPAHFLRSFFQMAPQVIVYCWIAMAIYALTRNKIVSQAISILLLFFLAILHSIGAIDQHFFLMGLPPDLVFSDFHVMAASNSRHLSFDGWYLGIAGILTLIAMWLWPRGTDASLTKRLSERPVRFSYAGAAFLSLAFCSLAWGGFTAWRDIHREHSYRTQLQTLGEDAAYEKKYSTEESQPQPRVQALNLKISIDPVSRQFRSVGQWSVINANTQPIDHLHIEMPESSGQPAVHIGNLSLLLQSWDAVHRVGIWRLPKPLASGETLNVDIDSDISSQGFEEKPFEGTIGSDTAWFNTSFLPLFGYDRTREIDSPAHRSEQHLGPRKDRAVRNNLLAANDNAGWVDLNLAVSVPSTWTVRAEGKQNSETVEGDRKIVRFDATQVPLAVQVVAGKLLTHAEVLTSRDGRRIPLTISYLAGHGENVDRMAKILKSAFAEWEFRFGPCPSAAITLAEIPQYQTDTEPEKLVPISSAGGLIVMPERLGWLHDYRHQPVRDWLAFILSEDLARSWWGDRVAAREGPGSALIDDGVPTLMGLTMLEKLYGTKAADDYAGMLQDRLRKETARESGPVATVLTTNFEEYADIQAALALYERRSKLGRKPFDYLLDQSWTRWNSVIGEQHPISPNEFAQSLGMAVSSAK